jgi:hypothetical protein
MTLVSFSASKRLANLSEPKVNQLPTPFQLGLLIKLLEGAILDSLKHLLKRKEETKLARLVKLTVWALMIVNVLGYIPNSKIMSTDL